MNLSTTAQTLADVSGELSNHDRWRNMPNEALVAARDSVAKCLATIDAKLTARYHNTPVEQPSDPALAPTRSMLADLRGVGDNHDYAAYIDMILNCRVMKPDGSGLRYLTEEIDDAIGA